MNTSLKFWIIVVASALLSSCGFYEFVWFMSVGYGFAVMGIGAAQLVLFWSTSTIVSKIMSVLFIVYGFRLGGFLLIRELKNKDYKKTLDATGSTKKMPIFVSAFMWVYCFWMYVAQTSPVTYRLINLTSDNATAYVGAAIMLLGILGESLADKTKSQAKLENPKRFCDKGIYKICRCPNYFSEVLFWTGCFISGFNALEGKQWWMATIGYILIVIVMINSAQRLEKRHEKNYGNDPEYRKYSDTTPILFPLLPIYHLNKIERGK